VNGLLVQVVETPMGSQAVATAAVGSSQIVVDNVTDFNEAGGTIDILGTQVDYSGIIPADPVMDAAGDVAGGGTLVLTAPLTVQVDQDDPVSVVMGDAVGTEAVAVVDIPAGASATDAPDGGDMVHVTLTYEQRAVYPTGVYDAPLPVELSDDLKSITGAVGTRPTIDGSLIAAGTLPPPTTDGNPPAASPTPTVTGGVGVLFVHWDPETNADPVTYAVHISTTTGFTPDATTLAATTAGGSATLHTLTDGTPLAYGTVYFVVVVARDDDGAAAPSTEAAGSPVQVTTGDVAADYIYGGTVLADQITAGTISSDLELAGTIKTAETGARVELSPDGVTVYDPSGNLTTVLGADGQSTFRGDVEANGLTVTGGASLQGTDNEVSQASSLELASGVSSPKTAPTVTVDYLSLTASGISQPTGQAPPQNPSSLWWDSTRWISGKCALDSLHWVGNSNVRAITPTGADGGGILTGDGTNGSGTGSALRPAFNAAVRVGSTLWYYAPSSASPSQQRPYGAYWGTGGGTSMTLYTAAQGVPSTDGTTLYVAVLTSSTQVTIYAYNPATGAQTTRQVITLTGSASSLNGLYAGPGDFGANRWVLSVTDSAGTFSARVATQGAAGATVTENATERFPLPVAGPIGFDGNNFWGYTGTSIYRLEKWTTFATSSAFSWTWWAGYTLRNAAGGYEVPISPLVSFNMKRRARLTVTTAAVPADGITDSIGVYLATLTTTPTAAALYRQAVITTPTWTPTAQVAFSGPNPVTASTYPGGVSANLHSETGGFRVNGDGTGAWPYLMPPGAVIPFGGSAAPAGWLACTGAAVSRTTYAALFAAIGTTFGAGDGSTTFNLPNTTQRFPIHTTVGATGGSATISTANLPSHTHGLGIQYAATTTAGGTTLRVTDVANVTGGGGTSGTATTNATGSGSNYWPPYLGFLFIIKF
jgi:microcystin-dependent protein